MSKKQQGKIAVSAKAMKKSSKVKRRENFHLDMMVLPGFLLFLVFNYLPMIGLVIAFKDYNPNLGIAGSPWNGFENFRFFFESQDAVRTIRNTLMYSLTFLVLDLVCAVGLALMFYNLRSKKALKFYNTVVILPRFMSMVIIAFIVYILLNPSYGLMNRVIMAFGGSRIQWYSEAVYWPVILTIVHIWSSVGMSSIIYYASLMGLDEALLEAARLDGASKWQETWYVVIPHLIPVMVVNTILAIGNLFEGDFGLYYQVPKNVGLLYETTDIINTYTYRALRSGAFEKSTAVGLFQSAVGCILVIVTNKIVRKVSPENGLF
ncbi:MAG: sugar ABC transporter permease [Lachnospiraceae bacterium]|nr:sugar ABC transporter permease [Lachnospiraceae bacterium]